MSHRWSLSTRPPHFPTSWSSPLPSSSNGTFQNENSIWRNHFWIQNTKSCSLTLDTTNAAQIFHLLQKVCFLCKFVRVGNSEIVGRATWTTRQLNRKAHLQPAALQASLWSSVIDLTCQEFSFCLLCNRISCVAGSHFNFASVMIQFSWNRSLAKRQSAPIHGCIEENMDLGRKTAFLFGRAAVNAALYENCCSLPQLSWQWDIVEAVASNEGQRTSACRFIILDSSTHFECILCQAAGKTSESVELHLQKLKSQSAASF